MDIDIFLLVGRYYTVFNLTFLSQFLADINDPISVERKASVDESSVETLVSFGFQEAVARKALEASVSSFVLNMFVHFNMELQILDPWPCFSLIE